MGERTNEAIITNPSISSYKHIDGTESSVGKSFHSKVYVCFITLVAVSINDYKQSGYVFEACVAI